MPKPTNDIPSLLAQTKWWWCRPSGCINFGWIKRKDIGPKHRENLYAMIEGRHGAFFAVLPGLNLLATPFAKALYRDIQDDQSKRQNEAKLDAEIVAVFERGRQVGYQHGVVDGELKQLKACGQHNHNNKEHSFSHGYRLGRTDGLDLAVEALRSEHWSGPVKLVEALKAGFEKTEEPE